MPDPVRGVHAHKAYLSGRNEEERRHAPVKDEEHERYLLWLVETYGPREVAKWQDPPVTKEQWRARGCS